jgi:hypothetical protein
MEARVVLHDEDKFIGGVGIYINGGLCFWTKDALVFTKKIMELQRCNYEIVWPV